MNQTDQGNAGCRETVAAYDYALPEELIAQHPTAQRTDARLMVVDRARGRLRHATVRELPELLCPGDLLVVNNTRVIPARLRGTRAGSGGKVELLLLEPAGEEQRWLAIGRAARRIDEGAAFILGGGRIVARVESVIAPGRFVVGLQCEGPIMAALEEIGEMPLPPYIRRKPESLRHPRQDDKERYQTVYARHAGAVAAPTAGLHFTTALFDQLAARGIQRTELTLHVGIGTFRPVSTRYVADHRMEDERFEITAESSAAIAAARLAGGRIVAVGSTAVRALETACNGDGTVPSAVGRSRLFIHPPFTFRVVDAMLTNFHLPKSTLLMMVSAFAGRELVRQAYAEAVRERYRFFSYGDAMLII